MIGFPRDGARTRRWRTCVPWVWSLQRFADNAALSLPLLAVLLIPQKAGIRDRERRVDVVSGPQPDLASLAGPAWKFQHRLPLPNIEAKGESQKASRVNVHRMRCHTQQITTEDRAGCAGQNKNTSEPIFR